MAKFPAKDKKTYVKNTWQLHSALHLKNVKTEETRLVLLLTEKEKA